MTATWTARPSCPHRRGSPYEPHHRLHVDWSTRVTTVWSALSKPNAIDTFRGKVDDFAPEMKQRRDPTRPFYAVGWRLPRRLNTADAGTYEHARGRRRRSCWYADPASSAPGEPHTSKEDELVDWRCSFGSIHWSALKVASSPSRAESCRHLGTRVRDVEAVIFRRRSPEQPLRGLVHRTRAAKPFPKPVTTTRRMARSEPK